jgi:hypothetical protein
MRELSDSRKLSRDKRKVLSGEKRRWDAVDAVESDGISRPCELLIAHKLPACLSVVWTKNDLCLRSEASGSPASAGLVQA